MTGRQEDWGFFFAPVRIFVSFFAAAVIGSLALIPFAGGLALVFPIGVMIAGFPALIVAMTVAAIFHRSIARHCLVWCLVAPFVAVAVLPTLRFLFDHRGLDLASFLASDGATAGGLFGLFFASITAAVFHEWQRRVSRR